MNTLTNLDLQFVVRRLPKDVRELLMKGQLFVGGGFIRDTIAGGDVKDIDFFGPSKGVLIDAAATFSAGRKVKEHVTDNAITVLCPPRIPVQFITRWVFNEAESLASSFDFTVCQAVLWFDKPTESWKSFIGTGFYQNLAARRLIYTSPKRSEEAGGSIMRVLKFIKRGYNIQSLSLGAVISRITMGVKNIGNLDESQIAVIITSLLREVDPLLVVDGLEPIDEHEIVTVL